MILSNEKYNEIYLLLLCLLIKEEELIIKHISSEDSNSLNEEGNESKLYENDDIDIDIDDDDDEIEKELLDEKNNEKKLKKKKKYIYNQLQINSITNLNIIKLSYTYNLPHSTLYSIISKIKQKSISNLSFRLKSGYVWEKIMKSYLKELLIIENEEKKSLSNNKLINYEELKYNLLNTLILRNLYKKKVETTSNISNPSSNSSQLGTSSYSYISTYINAKAYLEYIFSDKKIKLSDFIINISSYCSSSTQPSPPSLPSLTSTLLPSSSSPSPSPQLIDYNLKNNLINMIKHDTINSPDIQFIKENSGKYYELLLIQLLNQRHIIYETEEDSKRKGRPKTPDILLMIPMAVKLNLFDKYSKYFYNNNLRDKDNEDDPTDNLNMLTSSVSSINYRENVNVNSSSIFSSPNLPNRTHSIFDNNSSQSLFEDSTQSSSILSSPQPSSYELSLIDFNEDSDSEYEEHYYEDYISKENDEDEEENKNENYDQFVQLQSSFMSTKSNSSSASYTTIHWIDSKSMFADKETFLGHIDQLRSYTNRYGRGLVIYWHGFTSDICELLYDDMILIRDRFPSSWLFPSGELADGRYPSFLKGFSNEKNDGKELI